MVCIFNIYIFYTKKLTQFKMRKSIKKEKEKKESVMKNGVESPLKKRRKGCWFGETACTMWHDWNHAAGLWNSSIATKLNILKGLMASTWWTLAHLHINPCGWPICSPWLLCNWNDILIRSKPCWQKHHLLLLKKIVVQPFLFLIIWYL